MIETGERNVNEVPNTLNGDDDLRRQCLNEFALEKGYHDVE
jgi:hypothetical protein